MRRSYFLGSFLVLLAALLTMWAFRFKRTAGIPTWRLTDLHTASPEMPGVEWAGSPERLVLRLRVDASNPRVAARIAISGAPVVEMLHLRFRIAARGLRPGYQPWEDGRFMVEWHSPDGGSVMETEPVASIRFDDQSGLESFVIYSLRGPAIPALRFEHLGLSGEFELTDLEISVIEERPLWKIGKWFLAMGWLVWGTLWIRSWPGISWCRASCASLIWLLMGIHFVIPGPWRIQRSIVPAFQLGKETAGVSSALSASATDAAGKSQLAIKPSAVSALGKTPVQGSFVLRVKVSIAKARPLLHALLLFGPSLVLAWLVGRRPALVIVVSCALAIELAQLAFGYGFDWVDVFDLACDAAGIALGFWGFGKIQCLRLRWRSIRK